MKKTLTINDDVLRAICIFHSSQGRLHPDNLRGDLDKQDVDYILTGARINYREITGLDEEITYQDLADAIGFDCEKAYWINNSLYVIEECEAEDMRDEGDAVDLVA